MLLSLPKSRLRVESGSLTRQKEDGTTESSHALNDILGANLVHRFSVKTLLYAVGSFVVTAWIFEVEDAAWRAVAVAFFAGSGLVHVSEFFKRFVRLELPAGAVEYELEDDAGESEGFVLSLSDALRRRREGPR